MIFHQIPDKDLEKRRTGQKVDPMSGEVITEDVYNPEKPQKEVSRYVCIL